MSILGQKNFTRIEAIEMLKLYDSELEFEESGKIPYDQMTNEQLAAELVLNGCIEFCQVIG